MASGKSSRSLRVLSIDIGGTGIKASVVDLDGSLLADRVRIATPYPFTPVIGLDSLERLAKPLPEFQRIAVGFPGVVRDGKVATAPHFGTKHWAGFPLAEELETRLGSPCRLINDAEMQGLAAIKGEGLELMLTLGTGAGTGLFREGEIMPHMELAHHPVHKSKTYNEYVGNEALRTAGHKRWNRRVARVIGILRTLLNFDHLFIGGGNSRRIDLELPPSVTLVPNDAGIEGGGILWRRCGTVRGRYD